MCVICVKPTGKEIPNKERMRAMFESNPDGSGFMFVKNQKVQIRKGFMKFKSLMKAIIREGLTKEDLIVFHFRIATAGTASPKNCHPFPISQDVSELRSTTSETDLALAHNGILSLKPDEKADLSDTMTFIRDILADPSIRKGMMEPAVWSLIEMSTCSSKMVFVDGDGKFVLLGNWSEDKEVNDGCFYSNLYFSFRLNKCTTYYSDHRAFYFNSRPSLGTELVLTNGIKGDLDAKAYANMSKDDYTEDFATAQAQASVLLFPEDARCPSCDHTLLSDTQQACYKCGKMFYRSYND